MPHFRLKTQDGAVVNEINKITINSCYMGKNLIYFASRKCLIHYEVLFIEIFAAEVYTPRT